MKTCRVKVFDELRWFVNKKAGKEWHEVLFVHKSTIRDAATSLGIPPPEIVRIELNGKPAHLYTGINDHDQVELYSGNLEGTSFILDVHLGTLARYMRMLGFDCYYRNDLSDEEIIERGEKEERTVLTRDLGILKNSRIKAGYFIRNTDPEKQLKETVRAFNLKFWFKPFSRCMNCNGILTKIDKMSVKKLVPEGTWSQKNEFFQCSQCSKIYWKGSHYHRMQQFIAQIR